MTRRGSSGALLVVLVACFFSVYAGHEKERSARPCQLGYAISPDFITEAKGPTQICAPDQYCRTVTVTALFREGLSKKYLAYGECINEDIFTDHSCDDERYCFSIMSKVLQQYVNESVYARPHRCSVRCCQATGYCLGSNTSPPRRYSLIEPEGTSTDNGVEEEVELTTIIPSTVDNVGISSEEFGKVLGGSSVAASGGDYGIASGGDYGVSSGGDYITSSSVSSGGDYGGDYISGASSGGVSGGSYGESFQKSPFVDRPPAETHSNCTIGDSVRGWQESSACGSNQACRSVEASLVYWNYTSSINSFYYGDCVDNDECESTDCDEMVEGSNMDLPEGAYVKTSSCTVKCCTSEDCVGIGSAGGGPYFPELEKINAVDYNSHDIPLLPGCSLNQASEDMWLCQTMFYNDFPYTDEDICRANVRDMKMCLQRIATSCLYGDKPTMWEAMGQYKPSTNNWEAAQSLSSSSYIELLLAMCDRDARIQMARGNRVPNLVQFPESFRTKEMKVKKMVNKVFLARDKFTFCRTFEEFHDVVNKALEEMVAESYSREYVNEITSPIDNYTSQVFNFLAESFPRRKIPRCMAIAQMEDEASMYEHRTGMFTQPDSNGCENYYLDVLIGIDGSRTIKAENFQKMLQFVKNITDRFPLKKNLFSLVQFSGKISNKTAFDKKHFRQEFKFGEVASHMEMIEALKSVKQLRKRRVFLEKVFDFAKNELLKNNKERANNPCVKKVIILVTRERFSEKTSTIKKAQELLDLGVKIIMVKIGDLGYNQKHYNNLVNGDPSITKHFYKSVNFDHMEGARVGVIEDLYQLFSDGTGMFVSGG